MQFEAKLTLDGLMTLVAGIIGFAAVIVQIRSSSRQLHQQLNADRDSEREENERQKKVVATAILFEIDSVYARLLDFVVDRAAPGDALGTEFPVFAGNASQLGLLDQQAVAVVVHFYAAVTEHALTARSITLQYRSVADKEVSYSLGDPRIGTILRLKQDQERNMKIGIERAGMLAREACTRLCAISGVPNEKIRALTTPLTNSN